MTTGTNSDFSQFKIVRMSAPVFSPTEAELSAFATEGLPVTVVDEEEPDELIPLVADADIVALIGARLPTQVIESLSQCRGIARMGTGMDKIDVSRATELGSSSPTRPRSAWRNRRTTPWRWC